MESPKPHIRKQRCSRAGFGSLLLCAAPVWLLAFPVRAGAQPADEFFHGGAQSYIQGQKEKAKEQVTSGLKQFPEDAKLNAMAVLLQKQEEKRQQQQQSQDQQQKDQSQETRRAFNRAGGRAGPGDSRPNESGTGPTIVGCAKDPGEAASRQT